MYQCIVYDVHIFMILTYCWHIYRYQRVPIFLLIHMQMSYSIIAAVRTENYYYAREIFNRLGGPVRMLLFKVSTLCAYIHFHIDCCGIMKAFVYHIHVHVCVQVLRTATE